MEDKKSILHELYVFSEWKPEQEYLQKPDYFLPENLSSLAWRWLKFFGPKKRLIDSVTAFKERQQKWHIALGDEGKVIAVLTDNILEIRTKRSEYATIAARTTVSRDPYAQWRKLVWSPDCSFLAMAYGNGMVTFFDLSASSLFNIPTDCNRPGGLECTDNTHAVADIIFMPLRVKDNKWNCEVLIVTFDGKLRGYMISSGEFKLRHTFRFTEGASAVALSHAQGVLYAATVPVSKDPSTAAGAGIQAWRILNDEPHYTMSVASSSALDATVYIPFLATNLAFVVQMVLSKDNTKLVCLHCNGDVSSWHLPSLKLLHRWPLASQPQCDLKNPLVKTETKDLVAYQPADVNWWTNEEIIVSRFSGAVSVCDLKDMLNILGKRPEFFQGAPQVTCAFDGTFMVLECESTHLPAKRTRSDDSMEVVEVETHTEDTFVETVKEMLKYVVYAVTDMEAFQPKPKKITVVSRIYRLLGVKSTTPSELFSRKIESGNYAEALNLASTYNLDSDLVYQQQWRRNPVSSETIHKYLSKVSKKIWAVHQCVDRLPDSLSAAKELLQFGLQLTNSQILEEINQDRPKEEHKTLEDITLLDLNASTSELLRCRHVMIFYSERLQLYEAILKREKSTYVKEEYHRLRSNNIVHTSMEMAKEARIDALTCLWPHTLVIQMKLSILDNIPETLDPVEYKDLLPRCIDRDQSKRLSPESSSEHIHDWCRKEIFRPIWDSNWSEDTSPYKETMETIISVDDPTIITQWYILRASAIEQRSGLISNAISLLNIAQNEFGISDLTTIINHFKTLEVLVYEINVENVTLKQVEKLNDLETCKLLMSKSIPATYVSDLKSYVLPFLNRSRASSNKPGTCRDGLIDFLAHESIKDLSIVYLVVNSDELELDVQMQVEMCERCILAHTDTHQLDLACDLLANILIHTDGSISNEELVRRVTHLERLVSASTKISWKGICVPPKELDKIRQDYKNAHNLLKRFARSMGIMDQKPTQQEWETLLSDLLNLQGTLFTCVSREQCHEIYASALLTSGDAASIKLAADVLTCKDNGRKQSQSSQNIVSYKRSIELVTTAAKEYFNSASSLTDPALELARSCLLLIRDDNTEISYELDQIAALHLLDSFGLTILPVQARLCTDKITLIEDCLEMDSNAFMASHKLLQLAKLMRIAGDDDRAREGQVLQLIGEYAIKAGAAGHASAADAARRLAALRHAPAAGLMAHVAQHATSHANNDTRKQLYGAAVTFCDGKDIERMLVARLGVELESLQLMGCALKEHQLSERAFSADDEFADAITTPDIEKKDLVAPAEKKPLLSYLLDSLQNKFTASEKTGDVSEPIDRSVHCQEFYRTLYPEYKTSDSYYRYNTFGLPNATNRGQQALKWYYVQNCLEDLENDDLEAEVIKKCVDDTIYSDTPFGVACLLRSLRTPSRTKRLLDGHHTDTAVCAALYAALIKCNTHLGDNAYLTAPAQMAQATQEQKSTSPSELMEIMIKCADKLSGMEEADNLKEAGFTVNALMFNADEDYRTQTIYRVARSQSPEHLKLACSLATKYNVDPLEVWLEHFTHAQNMSQLNVASLPGVHPNAYTRIKDALWPVIRGDDHNSLISYFTLLKNIDEKPLISGLTANEHVKLLKKAKAASSELDFKLLLTQPSLEEFSAHILEIIKPENVGMLTKFLRSLPPVFKIPMSVNDIYRQWLTKYFFSVPPSAASNKKWMQQYRQCASYFNKLTKHDLLEFVNNTCFSADAIERVPFQTRNLMIMQAVDYCHQEQENDFKLNKNEQSWAQVGQELTRWARFLENYHSDAVKAIIDNSRVPKDQIWPELEASHGDTEKVVSCCAQLVLRDIRPTALNTLLQCVNADATPARVLQYVADSQTDGQTIQTLVRQTTQYHKEGITLPESLIDRLMQKASELNLSPHKQISLLSLSDRAPIQDTGDLMKMAKFSMELLRNEFDGEDFVEQLTEDKLLSEDGRREVLTQVMKVANTWQEKRTLVDVLVCWPPHREGETKSLHCEYLQHLLMNSGDPGDATVLIKLMLCRGRSLLNDEEVEHLADITPNAVDAVINALWIILLSKCASFQKYILKLINKHKENFENHPLDDDLVKELLDKGMFIKLVPTPVYGTIINYIINQEVQGHDTPHTVAWASGELIKVNYLAEAGQLRLVSLGVPQSLRGFTQSVLYFKNKFMN